MTVNLGNWEVWEPNNSPALMVLNIPARHEAPSSRGGALRFVHVSENGSRFVDNIFSPTGYTRCTLSQDQRFYEIVPTFGTDRPVRTIIRATFVDIGDDDGTVIFENYDSLSGSRWPVAFIPRGGYVWIRYAGPSVAEADPEPV